MNVEKYKGHTKNEWMESALEWERKGFLYGPDMQSSADLCRETAKMCRDYANKASKQLVRVAHEGPGGPHGYCQVDLPSRYLGKSVIISEKEID